MDSSGAELLSLFDVQDDLFPTAESDKLFEEWRLAGRAALNEDADDFLRMTINPNEVYRAGGAADQSPESDSGFSDDPRPETPAPPLYQLVYDVGGAEERKAGGVISIQLEDWSSPVLIPESCVVPLGPAPDLLSMEALYPELHLTDEERRLLTQEGVALPNNLPLTKAEERILKKVRRKIRNKQSAQDSRRRKKEYIDGLESRVAACSAQNQELHKKVLELEKHNISLITQLRKLQTLIKQTSTKAAQTGTCVLILIFSLALLIYPNYHPLRSGPGADQAPYTPTGVISRNILNKGGFSEVTEPPATPDGPTPELRPQERGRDVYGGTPPPPEQAEVPSGLERPAPEEPVTAETPPLGQKDKLQFRRSAGKDRSKPAHSDEI